LGKNGKEKTRPLVAPGVSPGARPGSRLPPLVALEAWPGIPALASLVNFDKKRQIPAGKGSIKNNNNHLPLHCSFSLFPQGSCHV
jgi:hypothetical protein